MPASGNGEVNSTRATFSSRGCIHLPGVDLKAAHVVESIVTNDDPANVVAILIPDANSKGAVVKSVSLHDGSIPRVVDDGYSGTIASCFRPHFVEQVPLDQVIATFEPPMAAPNQKLYATLVGHVVDKSKMMGIPNRGVAIGFEDVVQVGELEAAYFDKCAGAAVGAVKPTVVVRPVIRRTLGGRKPNPPSYVPAPTMSVSPPTKH